VFCVKSPTALLLFLDAFPDLEKVRRTDGRPLLHQCIEVDIANEEVISALKEQLHVKWKGWIPISQGEENDKIQLENALTFK
jgi:hypothetical protein